MGYVTLARAALHEEAIKASRFIAEVRPLAHVDDAEAFVRDVRGRHPAAHHTVWAWRWGDVLRWSDDGEPAGSAGRPVLEVVLKRDLDRLAITVTRYFGGTKLGVGGLVRAYGGSAAKALDLAGVRTVVARERWLVKLPYANLDAVVRATAEDPDVLEATPEFDAAGAGLALELIQSACAVWERRLADLTRGRARITERMVLDAD